MSRLVRFAVFLLLGAFAMAGQGTAQEHFQRGLEFFEQDLKKAEQEFRKAREADPGWAEPSFYLGLCAHARDDLKKAGRYYREALAKSPGHEQASYWLRTLADSEKLGEARRHRDRDQYSELADEVIAFLLQGGELRSALFDLSRTMERRFRGPGLFGPLFREFMKKDRLDLADEIVQYWAAEADADDQFALQTLRGAVHLRRGEEEQAQRICEELLAVAQQPGFVLSSFDPELFDRLGVSSRNPKLHGQEVPSYDGQTGRRKGRGIVLRGIVELDGRFTEVEILSGIGSPLDEAALRIVGQKPLFEPARLNGKPIRKIGVITLKNF